MTICHATSSETNPYNQITVDDDSIVKENGHGGHADDIIPPFDYVEDGVTKQYPGKNWDEAGRAIFAKGCEVPPTPPPPQPIQLFVKCVDVNGSTFKAVFGYTNPNADGGHRRSGVRRTRSLPAPTAASPRRSCPGQSSRRSR